MNWLYKNWPYAAIFTAVFLILLTPFWYTAFGLPLTLLFLHLPMYQIHQLEEHYHDRFRLYVNRTVGGGLEILTASATWWINCLCVWVLDFVLFYPAFYINLGWGLGLIYLVIINGLSHIGMAIRSREYNPGLVTSIILFLPFGGWSLYVISAAVQATWFQQIVGFAIGLAVQIIIIIYIQGVRAKLMKNRG